MKNFHLVLLVLIVTMFIAPSCNKPSEIGDELLEQDQVDIAFTDSITIVAKTVNADSIATFDLDNQLDYFLCGDLDDPIFGGVKATNYLQARLRTFTPEFQPDDQIDSVIFSIVYDTTAMYGNIDESYTINVHRVTEPMDNGETYYSNDAFMFNPIAIGSKTFTPNPYDSLEVINYINDVGDTILIAPSLRIPIDIAFGQEIFDLEEMDSTIFNSDSLFLENLNGFYVEAEGANKESLLSFSYRSLGSKVEIYYTRDDTIPKQYDLQFSNASVKSTNYDHYGASASKAGLFLENTSLGDSLLFVQGLQGVNVSFKFPHIESFNNVIINKATLDLTIATLVDDDGEGLDPVNQFVLSEKTEDGGLIFIQDVARALNVGGLSAFGGNLQTDEDMNLQTYQLNLSATLQEMINGEVPNEVIMTLSLPGQQANRSIIYGPGHSTYPAKLNVTYSDY